MDYFAVIDTETNWNNEVMSIGAVIAEKDTFKKVDDLYFIFDPEYKIGGMFSMVLPVKGRAPKDILLTRKIVMEKFKEAFEKYVEEKDITGIVPIIEIDKQISLKDIDSNIVKQLDLLEPFGEANRRPIFVYKNLKIDSIRALSDGKHLKMTLKDGNTIVNAIGFNMGQLSKEYMIGDRIDVVGTLEINAYNGREMVQINVKDIMKSL